MVNVKDIIIKVIPSKMANDFIKKNHYSGKVVQNSSLHFGAFLNNRLHGVLSFGSPLDKRKILPLVFKSKWNDMLELNRLAFDEWLPKNSESRCISIAVRLIKKNASHVKWLLSFADGTQCGDGTIYRACGFLLAGIKKNTNTCLLPDGSVIHKMTLESNPTSKRSELNNKSYYDITGGCYNFKKYVNCVHGKILEGYQLKYVYLIDKTCELTVPIIPYSRIDELGIGMYKGKNISIRERNASVV